MIQLFLVMLLETFGLTAVNLYSHRQHSINRINTSAESEMTSNNRWNIDLTKQSCDYINLSIHPKEEEKENILVKLEHPFLDVDPGVVPGVSYSVRLDRSNQTVADSTPSIILLRSTPPGYFIEIPSWATPCPGDITNTSSTEILFHYIPGRTLLWNSSTYLSDNDVTFTVLSQDKEGLWKESRTTVSQRTECILLLSSHFGTISSRQLTSYFLRCKEFDILMISQKYKQMHVKFLGLSTGPEGSISIFTHHENAQPTWYISPNSSTTEGIPPVFISQQRFVLLKFHSCAECNVSATFYSLGGTNGCNETMNHTSGSLKSARFSEVDDTQKDCFYYILAPYGDRILLSVVQYGDSSEFTSENCTENILQVYGALGNKTFKFCRGLNSNERNHNLISQRNSLFLYFHSTNSLNNTDLVLNYTTVPACVHSNFEGNGSLCSRDIFHVFHKRSSCLIILDVLSEHNIEIGFPLVEVSRNDGRTFSCDEDFIEVLTEKSLVKLCLNATNQSESLMFHSVRAWMFLRVYLKRYSLLTTSSGVFCIKYKTAPLITSSEKCKYPWVARGYYCYGFFEQFMTWENASSYCLDKGGHLVTISDFEIQQVIEELIRSNFTDSPTAVWIGASDLEYENYYIWADGQPFEYSNWFPGWLQYNHYGAQPSDDGLANQDCVELRNLYRFPSKGMGQTKTYYWNDRNCGTLNPFICQQTISEGATRTFTSPECNRSIVLWSGYTKAFIESPGFPISYPPALTCHFSVTVPHGKQVELRFNDFSLEKDDRCSYDYLEIQDGGTEEETSLTRYCGNWTKKVKLLRFLSRTNQLKLTFQSDISNTERGFQAEVHVGPDEDEAVANLCDSQMFRLLNNTCYLLISYPEVVWSKANDICIESGARLAIAQSPKQKMVLQSLVESADENRSNVLYWMGGVKETGLKNWYWIDGQPIDETKFQLRKHHQNRYQTKTSKCLGIQRHVHEHGSECYWVAQTCDKSGKFICMKNATTVPRRRNHTLTGVQGTIASPNYPFQYFNNFHYNYSIVGHPLTRIYVTFHHLDLEFQEQCLYDYVSLRSDFESPEKRFCGRHRTGLSRLDFISSSNMALLTFHSDYSVCGNGFEASWEAIDVSNCQKHQKINVQNKSSLLSPHYPLGLLPNIKCKSYLETAQRNQILLTFEDFEIGQRGKSGLCQNNYVRIVLEDREPRKSVVLCGNSTNIRKGFLLLSYNNTVSLDLYTSGPLKERQRGYNVSYETWNGEPLETTTLLDEDDSGVLTSINFPLNPPEGVRYTQRLLAPLQFRMRVIFDSLTWEEGICKNKLAIDGIDGERHHLDEMCTNSKSTEKASEVEVISSSNELQFINLNPWDRDYKPFAFSLYYKVISGTLLVNQSAVNVRITSYDQCRCENSGKCEQVTNENGYECRCAKGFTGRYCDQNLFRIPFKPLSQRMLEEPFWLGLITMSVVLLVIILVYCVKRKFADKIERFLAEEIEKSKNNPSPSAACYGLHPSQGSHTQASMLTDSHPNSLFNRLRTHSFCASFDNSLNSPSNGGHGHSFNFDDFLKRSHSTKKLQSDRLKRDNEKNNKETSEILASLVKANQNSKPRRMSLDEFLKTSGKLKLTWLNDNPKSMSTTSEEISEGCLGNQLAPQFSCHSAPSFAEFNQSMDEQSFEHETSENPQCKVKMEDMSTKSSPIQTFGDLIRKNIVEQAVTGSVEELLQQEFNTVADSHNSNEKLIENLNEATAKQSNSSISRSETAETLTNFSLPPSPIKGLMPSKPNTPKKTRLRKLGLFFPKKFSAEYSPPKILITSNMNSCEADVVSPNVSAQSVTYLSPQPFVWPAGGRTASETNLSTSGYCSLASPGLSRSSSCNPVEDTINGENGKNNQIKKSSSRFLQVPNTMDNSLRPRSLESCSSDPKSVLTSDKKAVVSSKPMFEIGGMGPPENTGNILNLKCFMDLPREKTDEEKRKSREAFHKLVAACSSRSNEKLSPLVSSQLNAYSSFGQISVPTISSLNTLDPHNKEQNTNIVSLRNNSRTLRNPNKAKSLDGILAPKAPKCIDEKLRSRSEACEKTSNVFTENLNSFLNNNVFKRCNESVTNYDNSKSNSGQTFCNHDLNKKRTSNFCTRSFSTSDLLLLLIKEKRNTDEREYLSLQSINFPELALLEKRKIVNDLGLQTQSIKCNRKPMSPKRSEDNKCTSFKMEQNSSPFVFHKHRRMVDGEICQQLQSQPRNAKPDIHCSPTFTPSRQRHHPSLQRQAALQEQDIRSLLGSKSPLLPRNTGISNSKPAKLFNIPSLSFDKLFYMTNKHKDDFEESNQEFDVPPEDVSQMLLNAEKDTINSTQHLSSSNYGRILSKDSMDEPLPLSSQSDISRSHSMQPQNVADLSGRNSDLLLSSPKIPAKVLSDLPDPVTSHAESKSSPQKSPKLFKIPRIFFDESAGLLKLPDSSSEQQVQWFEMTERANQENGENQ